jgi:sodium/bile acid cotransporter 7
VQGVSLLLIPLMCWTLDGVWASLGLSPDLRAGLLVLGALPTTITSCVALTTAAGGNQGGAVVNASLGNLLGIVVTPMWLMLTVSLDGVSLDLLPVFEKLGLLVILPLAAGQITQLILGERLPPGLRKRAGTTGQFFLLGIVYISFQHSFHRGPSLPLTSLAWTGLIILGLHVLWLWIPWTLSRIQGLGLDPADRRCALICASQKTLALGLPLIHLCFPGHPGVAFIALPLLLYHPLQLMVAAVIAPTLNKQLQAVPDGGTA